MTITITYPYKLFRHLVFTAVPILFFCMQASAQYCTLSFPNYSGCMGGNITRVNLGTLDHNISCIPGGGYHDFRSSVNAPTLFTGVAYPVSFNIGANTFFGGVVVWIDFDNNQVFDASEKVFTGTYVAGLGSVSTYNGFINIPFSAVTGATTMRVVAHNSGTPTSACGTQPLGEAHDYKINISNKGFNTTGISPITNLENYKFCEGIRDFKVRVRNSGENIVYNVNIDWSINGVNQPTIFWSYPLDTFGGTGLNDTLITLGQVNFSFNNTDVIKVWTSLPNNVTDTVRNDDTILISPRPRVNCDPLPQSCLPAVVKSSSCPGGSITGFSLAGVNKTLACKVGGGYTDYSDSILAPVLLSGKSYPLSVTVGSSSSTVGAGSAVWIDFNRNGAFEANEQVLTGSYGTPATSTIPYTITSDIAIPPSVLSGYLVVRVVASDYSTPASACGSLGYGEVQDYLIYVQKSAVNNAAVAQILPESEGFCSGTQTIKARIENNGVNMINVVTVNWSVDGIAQQPVIWSAAIDTSGTATPHDTLIDLGLLYFSPSSVHNIKVWTSNPNSMPDTTNYDDTLSVTLKASVAGTCANYTLKTYCTPTFSDWTECVGGNISNVTFAGINKNTVCTPNANYYRNYTQSVNPAVVNPGEAYPVSLTVGGGGYLGGVSIWIDFNQNGVFEVSERVYSAPPGTTSPFTFNGVISIPLTARAGHTTMRVMGMDDATPTAAHACVNGISDGLWGEAQDYVIKINDKPGNNAGVTKHVEPKNFCPGTYDVKVRIENFGQNRIDNVKIGWSLNGVAQTAVSWTHTLDTLGGFSPSDTVVTIGSVNFAAGVLQNFKVWTFEPNLVADTINIDDTLTFSIMPAISGTFTIGASGNYTSFAQVASVLNSYSTCGNVIFNVAAGSTFNESPLTFLNLGSNTDTIIFRKSGTGANPIINCTGTSATHEAAIDLRGAANVSFDGIDIRVTGTAVEYGYRLTNSTTRGSSNNVIKNAKVILNRSNAASIGLVQTSNSTFGGGTVSTSFNFSNHNNQYRNIRIENSYNGIIISGAPAYPDTNCVITSEGSDTTVVGSLSVNDIGNGSAAVYGILLNNVRNSSVSKCTVRNVTQNGTNPMQGIMVDNGSLLSTYGNVDVNGNRVYNIDRTSGSTNTSNTHGHGIRIELGANATARIYNNVVYGMNTSASTITANATVAIRGMSFGTTTGTGTAYFYNNSVSISPTMLLRSNTAFWKAGTGTVVLTNNILSNTTGVQSGVAKHYVIYRSAGTITASNNLLWVANTNGFLGYFNTDQATMLNWRTVSGQDLTSFFYRPAFTAATNLAPNPADTASWLLNGRALFVSGVNTDYRGVNRPLTVQTGTPDIGAYEFTPTSTPPQATAVPVLPVAGGTQVFLLDNDTVAKINWNSSFSVPSKIKVRVYSGEVPSPLSLSGHEMINSYYKIEMPWGTYNYTVDAHYKNVWIGSIQNASDFRPATKTPNTNWFNDIFGMVDQSRYILKTSQLTDSVVFITGANMNDPLPVKLLDFSGTVSGSGVNLKWVTASEKNNKGFMVERSDDGRSFNEIDFVKANNAKGQSAYLYTDKDAFGSSDVLYYRLKQVDIDGGFEYSNVIMVSRKDASADVFSVYPNPFNDQLILSAEMPEAAQITITDISGRTVNAEVYDRSSGHVMINTSSLKAGVYFLSVNTGRLNKTIKVMKQ